MTEAPRAPVLVLGWGSDLRRDDAAGRAVAAAVAELALPGVEVRSVTQLVPELAVELAGRQLVVLVDARPHDGGGVVVRDIASDGVAAGGVAGTGRGGTGHQADPGGLLAMARLLGLPVGQVAEVTIPAADLGLGEGLTPDTADLVDIAVDEVLAMLGSLQGAKVTAGRAGGRRAPAGGR